MINRDKLGHRLIKIRENEGIKSARAMAEILGIDHSYYNKAEKGGGLSMELLGKLCTLYGYSKNWLLFGEGVEKLEN